MPDSASDQDRVALALRISPEPGSIHGELSDAVGSTWPFVGWLEFVAAVDAARAAKAARAVDPDRSGAGHGSRSGVDGSSTNEDQEV